MGEGWVRVMYYFPSMLPLPQPIAFIISNPNSVSFFIA